MKLRENYIYDFHFKAWNYSVQELKTFLSVIDVDYSIGYDKFFFEEIKYHKALEIEKICNANGSILFIDKETKSAVVEYNFNKRIGFFNDFSISTITKFVETMEKQNIIDYYNVNQDKIIVGKDDFEFIVSASATKTRVIESAFFVNVILLILKTEYADRFDVNFEPDRDVFSSIKYSNKVLGVKNRLLDNELIICRTQ